MSFSDQTARNGIESERGCPMSFAETGGSIRSVGSVELRFRNPHAASFALLVYASCYFEVSLSGGRFCAAILGTPTDGVLRTGAIGRRRDQNTVCECSRRMSTRADVGGPVLVEGCGRRVMTSAGK